MYAEQNPLIGSSEHSPGRMYPHMMDMHCTSSLLLSFVIKIIVHEAPDQKLKIASVLVLCGAKPSPCCKKKKNFARTHASSSFVDLRSDRSRIPLQPMLTDPAPSLGGQGAKEERLAAGSVHQELERRKDFLAAVNDSMAASLPPTCSSNSEETLFSLYTTLLRTISLLTLCFYSFFAFAFVCMKLAYRVLTSESSNESPPLMSSLETIPITTSHAVQCSTVLNPSDLAPLPSDLVGGARGTPRDHHSSSDVIPRMHCSTAHDPSTPSDLVVGGAVAASGATYSSDLVTPVDFADSDGWYPQIDYTNLSMPLMVARMNKQFLEVFGDAPPIERIVLDNNGPLIYEDTLPVSTGEQPSAEHAVLPDVSVFLAEIDRVFHPEPVATTNEAQAKRTSLPYSLNLATLNVRTLNNSKLTPLKLTQLDHLCNEAGLDIVALQEIRLRGNNAGQLSTRELEHFRLYYAPVRNARAEAGVGFLVRKLLCNSIKRATPLSHRLMSLTLSTSASTYTFLNAYAPTDCCKDEDLKDAFFAQASAAIASTADAPARHYCIPLGDFNGRVGVSEDGAASPCLGPHGIPLDEPNGNGYRLLELASRHDMAIANTYFPTATPSPTMADGEPENFYGTWYHLRSKTWHQIDFIVVPRCILHSVQSVLIDGSFAELSDSHIMLRATIVTDPIPLSTRRRRRRNTPGAPRVDQNAFIRNVNDTRQRYGAAIRPQLQSWETDGHQPSYQELHKLLMTADPAIITTKEVRTSPAWVTRDPEFLHLVEATRAAFALRHSSEEAMALYKDSRREKQRRGRQLQHDQDKEERDALLTSLRAKDVRRRYQVATSLFRTSDVTPIQQILADDGSYITDPQEMAAHLSSYTQQLLQAVPEIDWETLTPFLAPTIPSNPVLTAPFSVDEVRRVLERMPLRKAGGPDIEIDGRNYADISIEQLRYADTSTQEGPGPDILQPIVFALNHLGPAPPQYMSEGRISLLPKVSTAECGSDFRTLCMYRIIRKLYCCSLLPRLHQHCNDNNILHEAQYGFRTGRSTSQPIQLLQHLRWLSHQKGKPLYIGFIDISKAYDTVVWSLLWAILEHYGVPVDLIATLKGMYHNTNVFVNFQGCVSDWFTTKIGLPQGDPLSPLLFSIYFSFFYRLIPQLSSVPTSGVTVYSNIRQHPDCFLPPPVHQGFSTHPVSNFGDLLPASIPVVIEDIQYADDVATVEESVAELQQALTNRDRVMALGNLHTNYAKTKWLHTGDRDLTLPQPEIKINGVLIEQVTCFKYLGCEAPALWDDGLKELRKRRGLAVAAFDCKFGRLFSNKEHAIMTKLLFYKESILPILFDGVERWFPTTAGIRLLESTQHQLLLRILGRSQRDRIPSWKIYQWLRQHKIIILPMYALLHQRHLLATARMRRDHNTDALSNHVFWGDFATRGLRGRHTSTFLEEKHITRALVALGITTQQADATYKHKQAWTTLVRNATHDTVGRWIQQHEVEHLARIDARGGVIFPNLPADWVPRALPRLTT